MAEDVLGFDLHILFGKATYRQAGTFIPEKIIYRLANGIPGRFFLTPLIYPQLFFLQASK